MENSPKGFNKAHEKAKSVVDNQEKLKNLLKKAGNKAAQSQEKLKSVWIDLQSLLQLVKAWRNGEYKKVPVKTILLAVAAILYFVNPFDIIPDFIFLWGYIDDATVIAFVVNSMHTELEHFRMWQSSGIEDFSHLEDEEQLEG